MTRTYKNRILILVMTVVLILVGNSVFFTSSSYAAKEHFDNWEAVAQRMATLLNEAKVDVEHNHYNDGYKKVNKAYFGYYEIQGFEKNVMVYISSDRVNDIESGFRTVKHELLGNQKAEKNKILDHLEKLKVQIYKDAMVLDGKAGENDKDAVGGKVNSVVKDMSEHGKTVSKNYAQATGGTGGEWGDFITAFLLLLREGLEAILVIVAIVAYLVKTNNKALIKHVYRGCLWAILASIALAGGIHFALGSQAGVAREMMEGITMFIAVAVLFYVSNWILSKSEVEVWDNYINTKVQDSINTRSGKTLVFAAFLAVFREGAELILFYSASFSSGMSNPWHILLGILAGAVVLAIVYVVFRFTTVKLPLKPFFLVTSILLYLMCISFMGKGVKELAEANLITGSAEIPSLSWLNISILNISNTAETLIPQIMLVIASLWILLPHVFRGVKSKKKEK